MKRKWWHVADFASNKTLTSLPINFNKTCKTFQIRYIYTKCAKQCFAIFSKRTLIFFLFSIIIKEHRRKKKYLIRSWTEREAQAKASLREAEREALVSGRREKARALRRVRGKRGGRKRKSHGRRGREAGGKTNRKPWSWNYERAPFTVLPILFFYWRSKKKGDVLLRSKVNSN